MSGWICSLAASGRAAPTHTTQHEPQLDAPRPVVPLWGWKGEPLPLWSYFDTLVGALW